MCTKVCPLVRALFYPTPLNCISPYLSLLFTFYFDILMACKSYMLLQLFQKV